MKKIISILFLITVVAVSAPAMAFAIEGIPETCDTSLSSDKLTDECRGCGDSCMIDPDTAVANCDCGFCCMMNTIYKITDWAFYILMLLVTVFIIYGGFVIVTASGDPEKANKGKQVLTFAVMGLVIALLARVIPSLVRFIIGV